MRVGICFFLESNLGGAATQADDLVQVGKLLGHETCLIRFTHNPRAKNQFELNKGLPPHTLQINQAGMRFVSPRILITERTISKTIQWLNTFDALVFVSGCPHITRTFSQEDFFKGYSRIYTETTAYKTMFFTDPFWKKLYPYCKDVIKSMHRVFAFAEAYQQEVLQSGLTDSVEICNFGSLMAWQEATKMRSRISDNTIVWPHQWRSWKNPLMFIQLAPLLRRTVLAFADGIEYHKIKRDYPDNWHNAVRQDFTRNTQGNPLGTVIYKGTVSQKEIMEVFKHSQWMLDLTGMSGRTGDPIPKFVGNYQCVNIECMMLGCVNLKYVNTIYPHSQIPSECVIGLPLLTDPKDLAKAINKNLGPSRYAAVATKAREWAIENFNPLTVFQSSFLPE